MHEEIVNRYFYNIMLIAWKKILNLKKKLLQNFLLLKVQSRYSVCERMLICWHTLANADIR